jgi:hypothetical protein
MLSGGVCAYTGYTVYPFSYQYTQPGCSMQAVNTKRLPVGAYAQPALPTGKKRQ